MIVDRLVLGLALGVGVVVSGCSMAKPQASCNAAAATQLETKLDQQNAALALDLLACTAEVDRCRFGQRDALEGF